MTLLILFLQINIAISVCAGIALSLKFFPQNLLGSRATELKFNYLLLALCLTIPMLCAWSPPLALNNPAIEVWSRSSMNFDSKEVKEPSLSSFSISAFEQSKEFSQKSIDFFFIAFLWLSFFVLTAFFVRDHLLLRRVLRSSFLIRRIGGVSIYFSDHHSVPFSFWLPRNKAVVMPASLLSDRASFSIAIRHELQHHRQGDTRWALLIYFMNFFCWMNPLSRVFRNHIGELQEFACDEVLIGRKEISPHAYGHCLLAVAETALRSQRLPFGARGMAGSSQPSTIKRRITSMFKKKNQASSHKRMLWILSATSVVLVTTAVFAASGTIQDRRISLSEAQKLSATAAKQTEFPIEANDLVLVELNRYAGTPDGRKFIQKSLERMKAFEAMIDQKLSEYRLPEELKAVALVESGFQNLPEEKNSKVKGAGLWQFIPSSARHYDLAIENGKDDRLDPAKETDAALRYLGAMHLRFNKDWRLALMAYNMGERGLQRARDLTKSSDAWTLIRAGHENDPSYLAKVMAAVILMKNPEVLN